MITEPANIAEGPVNIKFTSNCISVMCPIKETSIKTWLLHKVTTFGQCGGIFTFEVCLQCSDASTTVSRCSINLLQEKPIIILNVLERAIRNNPNTNEIHYERSILGDIYHCDHDCTQPGRLMPAYSDPNIFSSGGSFSPPRTPLEATIEVYTTEQRESTDSGLPGTPQPEELSIASTGIPSPTSSFRSNVFRSPHHQPHYVRSPTDDEPERSLGFRRRQSDETPSRLSKEVPLSPSYITVRSFDHSPSKMRSPNNGRIQYAIIEHGTPMKLVRPAEYTQENHQTAPTVPFKPAVNTVETDTFPVDTTEQVPKEKRNNYNKLKTLQESTELVDDVIYDVPNCEFLTDPLFPASAPATSYMHAAARSPTHQTLSPSSPNQVKVSPSPSPDSRSPTHTAHRAPYDPAVDCKDIRSPSHTAAASLFDPAADRKDRAEDYEDAWVSPIMGRKRRTGHPHVAHPKNAGTNRGVGSRRRFQSSSDVLDIPTTTNHIRRVRSPQQNTVTRPQSATLSDRHLEKASNDFLQRLNEEEEKLSKVLAASRMERNEELAGDLEARDKLRELNRPYMFNIDDLDHDYADPDKILETCSNLVDYQSPRLASSYPGGGMLPVTKEPTNNIKGYAYKVTIPFTDTQYDVPRRTAAAPDLATMSHDAPPKPKRHTSTEHLYFMN